VTIKQLTEINKDSLEEYLLKYAKLITMAQDFIKCIVQELKQEVFKNVWDGELYVKNMHSKELQNIMDNYSIWNEYQDIIQVHKNP